MWFNVADPTAPAVVDSIDLGHSVYGLTAVDTIVYASTTGSVLYAISIADLHRPRILCQVTIPYNVAHRIIYVPPYLYLACEEAGVCVVETASVGLTEDARRGGRPTYGLVITPNPTAGRCIMTGLRGARADIVVRDVAGRAVLVEQTDAHDGDRYVLDAARLRAGVYFIDVNSDKTRSSVKLVKR